MNKLVRLPWVHISFSAMLRDVVDQGAITLTVGARPDVQTRRWYTLSWTGADELPHSVEASDMQLLLRRAAEVEQVARMVAGEGEDA